MNLLFLTSGILFTFTILLIYYLCKYTNSFICSEKLGNCEHYEDDKVVSQCAKCKGGPYFWNGDSENSKLCKQLYSTEEGKNCINSYNCPKGTNGIPLQNFEYNYFTNRQTCN